jgi:hypothetical protein
MAVAREQSEEIEEMMDDVEESWRRREDDF